MKRPIYTKFCIQACILTLNVIYIYYQTCSAGSGSSQNTEIIEVYVYWFQLILMNTMNNRINIWNVDLKKLVFGGFVRTEKYLYIKNILMQFSSAPLDSWFMIHFAKTKLSNFIFIFFTKPLEGYWKGLGEVIKNIFNSVLSSHGLYLYLESLDPMMSEKRYLGMTDKQTDGQTDVPVPVCALFSLLREIML